MNFTMEFLPEVELLSADAEHRGQLGGGIVPEMALGEGRFALVVVFSGMARGELRLADGRVPFKASGRIGESAILLVPPCAVFRSEFKTEDTEAFVFGFKCLGLAPQPSRMRLALKCGDGTVQSLFFAAPLSNYDAAILRPSAWRAYKDIHDPGSTGRRIRGVVHFLVLLSQLFAVPRNMAYWGNPAVVLQKSIEANPRGSTVRGLSRTLGCSPSTLRRRFRERTPGLSPSVYKINQTLHMMCYYIMKTTLPFKTVAGLVGFKSASHFTRYCVRYLGRTPGAIRASGRFPDIDARRP